MTVAGPARPIQTTTNPLAVMGGPARPIHVLPAGAVEAGAAVQVYEVSAAELLERGKTQGDPLRVSLAPARLTTAGPAIPVYVVAGTLGGVVPTPPAPSADWWLAGGVNAANAVGVYQPVGAANLADSYINLANPGTFDAAPGVAPAWNKCLGWTGNGVDEYLETGIIPEDGWSMLARVSNLADSESIVGSATSGQTSFFLTASIAGIMFYGQGVFSISLVRAADAVYGIAGQQGYQDGVADGAAIDVWVGTSVDDILLLAHNAGGTPSNFAAHNIQAVAIYSTTLTLAQIVAITAEMDALACDSELLEIFSGDASIAVQGNQERDIDEYWGSIIV